MLSEEWIKNWIDPLDAVASTHMQLGLKNPFCDCVWVDCPGPVKIGPVTHAFGNAGIGSLLAEGRSWSFIQEITCCSRATVAKVAKRSAAA